METLGKSAVNIIQELIAIHTTRKEAYSRMKDKTNDQQFNDKLSKALEQSGKASAALLNELSEFGDGVSGAVDLDIEFNNIWKNALNNFDSITTPELVSLYNNMEASLQRAYRHYIENGVELTDPLKDLLRRQSQMIS
jgi:hypothetical protein